MKNAYRWVRRRVKSIPKHVRARFRLYLVWLALVSAVVAGIWSLINYWDWLQMEQVGEAVGKESGSTTVRNIGLIVAGVVALPLALWRSWVAQQQADTAQQSLLNERYQESAAMLGSDLLAVRLGGVYALQRLAEEHPQQYHIQIMRVFCAFARHPTRDEGTAAEGLEDSQGIKVRQDVLAVMAAISTCHARQLELEKQAEFQLDLRRAELPSVFLMDANLSGANLAEANLQKARLWFADLSKTNLSNADLTGALFWNAEMSRALFWSTKLPDAQLNGAKLSDAQFSMTRGSSPARALTQSQLDAARADPERPPKLDGVLDAETGEQLVWRGKSLNGSEDSRRTN